MENKNNNDLYDLVEKAKIYEDNRELIGTVPITGILKKTNDSRESVVMVGFDVDDICPPWWPKRWPPGPWPWPPRQNDIFGPHPEPWIQKDIRINIKDIVKHEIIDQTKDGESIIRVYVNEQSITEIRVGIKIIDLVSLNPQPLPPKSYNKF